MYLLGIDLGSSSVKVALVDANSKETLDTASYPAEEMSIHAAQEGWAEQAPELWWEYVKHAVRLIIKRTGVDTEKVSGIGIAYQMHGLVIVDKNQEVLRPAIIWCDSRAIDIGEAANNTLGQEKCLRQFLNSPGNFTASKLKWVKENEPSIYAQIDKIMLPGDYIAMKLTGEISTTISGLSEGILWDFKKKRLATDLIDHFGFDHSLIPNLCETFGMQGKLTEKAAEELGLSTSTVIAYRAGDQPNNAMSLGVIHPNQVAATGGTSGVIYGISDEAKYEIKSRVNSFAHVNHNSSNPRIGVLLLSLIHI